MNACNLEVFGPIAPVITAKDEDEAVINCELNRMWAWG
jgi:acyl-CoA reductase-like NAD-dependent aldehyde dehydrogenase